MRSTLMFAIVAGLAVSMVSAQDKATSQPGTETKQPATPNTPTPAQAAAPVTPPMPKPIPVPNGEVLKRTELEGGLIAEDLKIGDGFEISPTGSVVALYHGTLKEGGKVFDSAFERGEPIAFPLSGVIRGWQVGVPGMRVGGVRRLTIPAAMAYGERGAGADIPPNSDLVFVIQLTDAVRFEDIRVGTGEEATQQTVAVTTHSIKNAEGKEVEKCDTANPYIWFPGECRGIAYGMEGMKVGGKRRIIIPKEFNEPEQGAASSREQNVPITVEVDLVAMRNLPQRRR